MIYNMSGMQDGTTLICHSVDVSLLVLDEVDCKEYENDSSINYCYTPNCASTGVVVIIN